MSKAAASRKRVGHKGFDAKLRRRAECAVEAGNLPPCTCWDCIRSDGLTPPKDLRHRFPARYPYSIFGKDEGGEPVTTLSKKTEHKIVGGSEASNLREAVRNRSAM